MSAKSIRIIYISILFGILGWIADTIVDVVFFQKGPFWELLILDVPSYEIFVRTVFFVLIVALGVTGSLMYSELEKKRLEVSREKIEWERTFNSVPDLVAVIGNDFRIKKVNKALYERIGEAPDVIEGTMCYHLFHDADAPPSYCPHFHMLRNPTSNRIEIYSDRLDGHFLVSVDPLCDEKGEILGSVHIARDITERKISEETLKESQRFIQQIAETTPDILYIFDLARKTIVFANQRLTDVLGYSVDEINKLGESIYSWLIHPDDAPTILDTLGRIERAVDNEVIETELRIRHRDGSWRWLRFSSIIYDRTSEGRPLQVQGAGIDISASKLAEEALRTSEEKFRMLFNKVNDAVVVYRISPDGGPMNFIEVNDVACSRYGYSRDEFLRMSLIELNPAGSEDLIRRGIANLLTRGSAIVESFHISKDGKAIPVEINAHLFEYEGKPTVLSIARDMTERKKAAEAMKIKDKAIDSSINAIAIAGLDARLSYVNPAFLNMWGFDNTDDVLGEHVKKFWAEDEDIDSIIKEVYEKNGWVGALRAIRKDGREMFVELVASIVRDDKGEPLCLMGSFVNVTERKQAEERLRLYREDLEKLVSLRTDELRASEEDLRNLSQQFDVLLDVIPDSLFVFTSDLKVSWANRSAQLTFGKEHGNLSGKKCCVIWHDGEEKCDECFVNLSFETGEPRSGQLTSTNGRIWDMNTYPITDSAGSVGNVMLVSSDITEKVELQAERMRAAHLASLGELAAGVAHEINNPINGIINYAQILANRATEGSMEADVASRIMNEGDRITTIVRSLLSFARDRKEKRSPVSIKDLLIETLVLTEVNLVKHGIGLKLDIADDLPLVIADPQQLMQVFLNIINNARYSLMQKDSVAGKQLSIRAAVKSEGREVLRITFHDNGIGIPRNMMDKIMNPFFTTKPPGIGTGLGLSISHGIITDHGGRILVDSVEGEFATMTIELPINGVAA